MDQNNEQQNLHMEQVSIPNTSRDALQTQQGSLDRFDEMTTKFLLRKFGQDNSQRQYNEANQPQQNITNQNIEQNIDKQRQDQIQSKKMRVLEFDLCQSGIEKISQQKNQIVIAGEDTIFKQIKTNTKIKKMRVQMIKKIKFHGLNKIPLKTQQIKKLNQFKSNMYDFKKKFILSAFYVALKHQKKNFRDFGKTRRKKNKKNCQCKNSYCLKLYCDCFRVQDFCSKSCKCLGCKNNQDHLPTRDKAITKILLNSRSKKRVL